MPKAFQRTVAPSAPTASSCARVGSRKPVRESKSVSPSWAWMTGALTACAGVGAVSHSTLAAPTASAGQRDRKGSTSWKRVIEPSLCEGIPPT